MVTSNSTRHLQKLYKELLEEGRIHVGKSKAKGLSTTTVHSVHLMLHAALERAVKERLIPRNPTEDCIAPKPRKVEMQILPSEDIHAYLATAKARNLLPMFYLELVSGLRKGELVALRWDDVDIQGKTISVSKQYDRNPDGSLELTRPKTENSVRLVSIPQTAVDLLIQEHGKHPDSPYLFPCRVHPPYLHPRHTAKAGRGSSHHGQLYGTGHVRQREKPGRKAGQEVCTSCPALFRPFRVWVSV